VLDLRVRQRRAIAFRYRDAFADLPGISLMPQAAYGLHTNWLSCFLIVEGEFGCFARPTDPRTRRSQRGVPPSVEADASAAAVRRLRTLRRGVAEDLFRRGICLPSSSSLSAVDQLHVVNAVRAAAGVNELDEFGKPATVQSERMAQAGD